MSPDPQAGAPARHATIIGVDPGLSGAIAVIAPGGIKVFDMPVIALSKTGFVKNAVDVHGVAQIFREATGVMHVYTGVVFLERVNAFPGQGVGSMFSLGMSFWSVAGVAAALGLEFRLVNPAEWKRHYRLDADKELARGLASRMFPQVDLSRKKDHNRAEALLIANYGKGLL